MVIPTTGLLPLRSDRVEGAFLLTCENPSPSVVSDWKVSPRNRKVVGSTPTSGSPKPQVRGLNVVSITMTRSSGLLFVLVSALQEE